MNKTLGIVLVLVSLICMCTSILVGAFSPVGEARASTPLTKNANWKLEYLSVGGEHHDVITHKVSGVTCIRPSAAPTATSWACAR